MTAPTEDDEMPHQVVALGNRLYRVDRGWASSSEQAPLSAMSSVAWGPDGLVYVLRREPPYIVAFNADGTLARSLENVPAPDGHGIFAATDGSLWVTARDAHTVLQVDLSGRVMTSIGDASLPRPRGPFGHPTRAVVAPDGEVYVSDGYADAVISRYSGGRLVQSWGSPGQGPGQFRTPHSLWVTDTQVFVVDRDNDRLQVFGRDGELQSVWSDFLRPMDVYVDGDGLIFVSEQAPRLSMWDQKGTMLGRCRLPSVACHGIAGDDAGNLYVAELFVNVVTRLTLIDVS